MATELWLPRVKSGWLSGFGTGEHTVSADLDGVDIWYRGTDASVLTRAFYRAALRTVLRRWLPWIAAPVAHRNFD